MSPKNVVDDGEMEDGVGSEVDRAEVVRSISPSGISTRTLVLLGVLTTALFTLRVVMFIAPMMVRADAKKIHPRHAKLAAFAKYENARCPRMIGQSLRVQSVSFFGPKLEYLIVLNVEGGVSAQAEKQFKEDCSTDVLMNAEAMLMLQQGFEFGYHVKIASGTPLFSFALDERTLRFDFGRIR